MEDKGKIAEHIVWLDAHSGFSSWTNKEDIPKPKDYLAKIDAIGFVVAEDEKALILAVNVDSSDGSISDWICIPKACIEKREVIFTPSAD